jgi:radical SAM/Cys-rich protein
MIKNIKNNQKNFLNFANKFISSYENPEIIYQRELRKKQEREKLFQEITKDLSSFSDILKKEGLWPLTRNKLEILQINIGKRCNLTCHHCHVESGPTRTENMEKKEIERLIYLLKKSKTIHTVDLTGGAPELNPNFKYIVEESRALGHKILDRCNLTVFYEEGMNDLPEFLAKNEVQIIASLPCYTPQNVDKQRGKGVFDKSIEALQWLNNLGYGKPGSNLELHLVYNPGGAFLPAKQSELEQQYKIELKKYMGIEFNKLLTITNMPIKRFADDLFRTGEYKKYMELLINNFNKSTVKGIMCKNLISVAFDGSLYDCDFNQALEINLGAFGNKKITIWDIESFDDIQFKKIATKHHCFGCDY